MEVTEVSELTATANVQLSIVLYIIMSNHNNKLHEQQIIISLSTARQVLRSSGKFGSIRRGLVIAIDVDSKRGGGGAFPRSAYFVQLLYVRSGHHQEKLSWSSMSKYKRRSVAVYNMFTVMFINDIHVRTL